MVERICIITRPDLQPTVHGAAVKIIRTAEALSRLGTDVYVVTNDRLWFYTARDGLLQRKRYPQTLLSLTNLPPFLKDRLATMGLPTYWHGLARALDRLGYPRDEHFLYQPLIDVDFWLRTLYVGWAHQIDVYQAEFPGYAAPAILAARLLGGQSALVEHNVEYQRLGDTLNLEPAVLGRTRAIELWCAQNVDHVVVVSEPDRQRLLRDGIPADHLHIIPHGVDLAGYEGLDPRGIRARHQLPERVPLLIFHGTLHYWPNTMAVKHIAEDLLPRLEARGIQVKVMICGMNPPRYYAHPDIVFTEVVQDLPRHIAAADLAVVPLDDGGGTRLKILEYFAAGLPVVSTSKGAEGIPVEHGRELLIADDMTAFADQVITLLEDPKRAESLGNAGRAFVRRFDWDVVCEDYLVLYRSFRPHPPAWGLLRKRPGSTPHAPPSAPKVPDSETTPDSETVPSVQEVPATQRLSPLPEVMAHVSTHIPAQLTPTKPLTMITMINRGCNLRCDFCDLYEAPRRTQTDEMLTLIDDGAALGVKTLVLTGGEPFLHPGLWQMITRARQHGMGTNVTTNGTLIEKHLSKLLESGLDSISVSLDGLKETHEALRKVAGCHEKTWRGLELLKKHPLNINIYFVVTGQNVHELVPVYQMARKEGFGFDFWPVNDAHHLYLTTDVHRQQYREAIDTLAELDPSVAARRDYYYAGLDYHGGWDKHVRCLGLIEQFGVNLDGDLMPCCVWDNTDLKVGNTRTETLSTLWYGKEAQARREAIFSKGCHNRCFNHSLYEFQLSTGLGFEVDPEEAP